MACSPVLLLSKTSVRSREIHPRLVVERLRGVIILLVLILGFNGSVFASVTASIVGTVKDGTGAVIPDAQVTVTNDDTQVSQVASTNGQGYYTFPALQPGQYSLTINLKGFKTFRQTGILLNVNDVVTVDCSLQVGGNDEVVTVSSEALHVETDSTQLGEVIEGQQMTSVPLNGRSYTDLLDLQPGVANTASQMTGDNSANDLFESASGLQMPNVSGEENPGNQSVDGMRETANGFLLNGVSVQESGFGGAGVIPNLDSLQEFRILTGNFDAEYGNFAGGQVNVVTKSGTNTIHGNLFEFLRNTDLDAANYFDSGARGPFQQSQFGGTVGGPIRKSRAFFFGDYQGTRMVQGISTGNIAVPTQAERSGDFSGEAASMYGYTVGGSYWASTLSSRLGYPVTAGEPYYYSGCTMTTACVFPNAKIPAAAWTTMSTNILALGAIPLGNGNGTFSTSGSPERLHDNKISGRVDVSTRMGSLFGYYNFDQFSLLNPYAVATVPGFDANTGGRSQVVILGDTKTLGSSAVNEARIGFFRFNDVINTPAPTIKSTLASLGFAPSTTPGGIYPLDPGIEGVPQLGFEDYTIGGPASFWPGIVENTYQASDYYSRQIGAHAFKAGAAFHLTQQTENVADTSNGLFLFNQTLETGVDFADFLIGAPGAYSQGDAPPGQTRSYYLGLFAQDSWHVSPSLTLNYGLRWDEITPWWEKHNEIEALKLDEQSVVFPNSPEGWVFPGDPGIPRTIAPIRHDNYGPRVGLAWSPSSQSGLLHGLTGGAGKSSVRAAYGVFYSAFEGAYDYSVIGDAPYGYYYSATGTMFADPFQTRATGAYTANPYPWAFPPQNVSASHPDPNVSASQFGVIGTSPTFNPTNKVPYAEQYNLSFQRQITGSDLLELSYVGTQGHRLLVTVEANAVDEAACYAIYEQDPENPQCGPNNEPTNLRGPFGANFGSEGYYSSVGASAYNGFQLNYQHTSKVFQILLGYTLSKSLDYSSGFAEQVNPFNPKLTRALSSFDQHNNFVISYTVNFPFKAAGNMDKVVSGWALSGITNFSNGLPPFIYEDDDSSLLGTDDSGPIPLGIDVPDYSGGQIHRENPRSLNHSYFNSAQFSAEPIGQLGTSRRAFFDGPGTNNFNLALVKDTLLTEHLKLQFRAEFFNVFNHTQFNYVNGNYDSTSFGEATQAGSPRIGQMALKLSF